MMKINKIAGALALFAATSLSGTALAASISVGTAVNITPYISGQFGLTGYFTQTYDFNISALSVTVDTVTNHYSAQTIYGNMYTFLNITGLNLSVYNSTYSQLLSSTGDGVSAFGLNVAPGAYHAVVSGTGTGIAGGSYTLSLAAILQPVPVPAAAWLLGSGLVGMVAVARRKEQA